ncbi:hypothetical protein EYR40_009384 [Pleurotus pulmonarius]|nr:hypothetical protein EYR38_009517 [Pleurotus pulmonarius]KAF4590787.1 hypothetical protein EYR40_009384 [Pleurotus pulmonarius]
MSAPEQRLLRQMCSKPETMAQASALIQRARLQTAPGSGHTLGSLSSGLPAVCAYIASTRLNNGDVTKQNAQLASCLQPSDFEKALGIIESATGSSVPAKATRRSTGITYESLFRQYNISESPTMLRIMHKIEQIVIKYAPDTSRRIIICTIFFWTCKVLKISSFTIDPDEFQERNEIDYDSYAYVINILKTKCKDLKFDLEDEWAAIQRLQASSSTASPVKPTQVSLSPTKFPSKKKVLRELPSRDTKKPEVGLFPATETVAPSTPTSPTKRRKLDPPIQPESVVEPSVAPADLPTPSTRSITVRRQPAIAPPPAATAQDVATISTPRRQHSSVSASPSKKSRGKEPEANIVDSSAMDVDEGAESSSSPSDDGDVLVLRRFRPIFLDHKQWYRRDPRMARIWRTAEAHRETMAKLYGHPFEHYRPQAVLSP